MTSCITMVYLQIWMHKISHPEHISFIIVKISIEFRFLLKGKWKQKYGELNNFKWRNKFLLPVAWSYLERYQLIWYHCVIQVFLGGPGQHLVWYIYLIKDSMSTVKYILTMRVAPFTFSCLFLYLFYLDMLNWENQIQDFIWLFQSDIIVKFKIHMPMQQRDLIWPFWNLEHPNGYIWFREYFI